MCGLERGYSLLEEGICPIRTDRPGSPPEDQVAMAWKPCSLTIPTTRPPGTSFSLPGLAHLTCSSLCDQSPSLSLGFLICPPVRLR